MFWFILSFFNSAVFCFYSTEWRKWSILGISCAGRATPPMRPYSLFHLFNELAATRTPPRNDCREPKLDHLFSIFPFRLFCILYQKGTITGRRQAHAKWRLDRAGLLYKTTTNLICSLFSPPWTNAFSISSKFIQLISPFLAPARKSCRRRFGLHLGSSIL